MGKIKEDILLFETPDNETRARVWSLPKRRLLLCGHFLLSHYSNLTAAHST
jgi:hypothetical protein